MEAQLLPFLILENLYNKSRAEKEAEGDEWPEPHRSRRRFSLTLRNLSDPGLSWLENPASQSSSPAFSHKENEIELSSVHFC
jgi:hypothetical protein